MERKINFTDNASDFERAARNDLISLFNSCPIPDNEILANLSLFQKRQDLSSILFIHELYTAMLSNGGVKGIIIEFGTRWGRNLALFSSLRGIYEPFNHNRKIIGFDTFKGHISAKNKHDGTAALLGDGNLATTHGYENYLAQIMDYHEKESPISHIKKYEVIKGDASLEIASYLDKNPHTLVAMAYFDFGVYEPTLNCLKAILPRLPKGAILGFDQLNCDSTPGELKALNELLDINNYRIMQSRFSPTQSYIRFGE